MAFGQQIKGFMCFGLLVWLNVAPWDLRFPYAKTKVRYIWLFLRVEYSSIAVSAIIRSSTDPNLPIENLEKDFVLLKWRQKFT